MWEGSWRLADEWVGLGIAQTTLEAEQGDEEE